MNNFRINWRGQGWYGIGENNIWYLIAQTSPQTDSNIILEQAARYGLLRPSYFSDHPLMDDFSSTFVNYNRAINIEWIGPGWYGCKGESGSVYTYIASVDIDSSRICDFATRAGYQYFTILYHDPRFPNIPTDPAAA